MIHDGIIPRPRGLKNEIFNAWDGIGSGGAFLDNNSSRRRALRGGRLRPALKAP